MIINKYSKAITLFICIMFCTPLFAGDKASFLKKQFITQAGYKLNYRVLYPLNYSPDKPYPVLLFLHGSGERGSDNESQLIHGGQLFAAYENQEKYPAIIIVPQCPSESTWAAVKRPSGNEKRYFPPSAPITEPLSAVKELLDSYIAKGVVDTKRIYIGGLSMGGMGTFDLVCRFPNTFAAATPICGGVNLQRIVNYKGKTAFRLYHGADDDVVDVQFSRDAYEILKKAGAKVIYKEFPGVNHDSWTPAFAEPDFLSWMFEQSL